MFISENILYCTLPKMSNSASPRYDNRKVINLSAEKYDNFLVSLLEFSKFGTSPMY